ncbi:MAG: M42 family metallopeptidase [Acidaminococcales bacterium]|jgi:endoglucanase|nr:M42 family metallopeptidase [Acidaminococcales bacterium]
MPVQGDKSLEWLKRFSEAKGVTGFEKRIKALLTERVQGLGDISSDGLGSVAITHKGAGGDGPRVMIAAHMDEVGFMVKHITKEGFLKFVPLGGWWEQVMLGQRVTVHAEKGDIVGIIGSKPPHILTAEERKKIVDKKDMFIDVGADDGQEVTEILGVRPGDFVTPECSFAVMGNKNYLLGKAWDNRAGCAIMAEALERLVGEGHPNTICAVGTVQEEVGLRGAITSANMLRPDVALVVDTAIAGGTPGISDDIASAKLGGGIAVTIYDASLVPNTALRDLTIETAQKEKIKYQFAFSEGGGTDGGKIHLQGSGVPTLTLSLPTRYIHSHQSIIHYQDYQAAVRLLTALVKRLDKKLCEALRS